MQKNSPTFTILPARVVEGDSILVRGSGWGRESIVFAVDGKTARPARILLGHQTQTGVGAADAGEFVVLVSTRGMKPGRHRLTSDAASGGQAAGSFDVSRRQKTDSSGRVLDKPRLRQLDFFERRFGHLGYVPPGMRETQINQVRALRERHFGSLPQPPSDTISFSLPIPGKCNWTPVGAGPVLKGQTAGAVQQAVSGRALCIAIDPTKPSTVYIGTANGGVWKSTTSGLTWSPKTDYARSLAISALAIDPHNSSRVFAGTGEYSNGYLLLYYGNGLLRSEDGGESWTELATATFERDEITRIVFDPTDASSQRIFLSAQTGVYESQDGGVTWTQLRAGQATALVVVVKNAGPPATVRLLAGFADEGVFTSTHDGTAWSAWTGISSTAFPKWTGRIALGQSRHHPLAIYAAFSSGYGLAGMARTADGGDTWTQVPGPGVDSKQTGYCFHVAVHPYHPDIAYYGEVRLWRTVNGGAAWVDVTDGEPELPGATSPPAGIHVDQHDLVFDPASSSMVWACNDGGVYRSWNDGGTWVHRNRDLATLQYMHISQHPQWESVMLGGAQDNGTHRYSGSPAWYFSIGGDGGFTAIDQVTPTRMYRGYIDTTVYRSDHAGTAGSWKEQMAGIQGSSLFYPPFELDPSNQNVCYFANVQLWRSPDKGHTWSAITESVGYLICSLCVHPTDPNTIYAGNIGGRVFRVQRSGPTWSLANMKTTDLAGPDLPLGLAVSDIAVDPLGTVWVTSARVDYTEATGEFTNLHVFRRTPGSDVWETRSEGLAKANPINTIVIDPTNSDRLFCGGDVGVFRTDDAGANWVPWDEGLPNAPVFHLAIHQPSRLLRAATHGRSVWERPIDALGCPMVDLYIRDNILDTGRVSPSPDGVPHPFDPTLTVDWSHSVDIKVDAPEGTSKNYQTLMPTEDYVWFEGDLQHRTARRDLPNRLYLQVHNRGVSKATGVTARVFVANTSAGYPPLPPDFWSAGKPFTGTPSGGEWTPVGPSKTIAVLEAGEPGMFYWLWTVSKYIGAGRALLAVVTCNEDPLDGAGAFEVPTLVRSLKHVALRRVQIAPNPKKPGQLKKTKPKKPVHPKETKRKPKKTAKKRAQKKTKRG